MDFFPTGPMELKISDFKLELVCINSFHLSKSLYRSDFDKL